VEARQQRGEPLGVVREPGVLRARALLGQAQEGGQVAAQREVRRVRRQAEAHGGPVARDPHPEPLVLDLEGVEAVGRGPALRGHRRAHAQRDP
jgi:hypothetical protein